ncbi:unnamed protein product [Cladocopium goreaui]|uniref:Phosphatidylinositol 4-phosphate 5-kinase 8 (AtPIP5K8) (1-phosphatidylinositol 4-phosphate kinase 8 ) (Diphosphoinositide kinase 8) (PtdIns(4)P-5-kinase 8) n=1 Tax=Cladocopium goreaui TaxID=2562237 RepID=A0A9P1CKF8_9DINO|nr:unnamed protein product [Cladocopium goreaui]
MGATESHWAPFSRVADPESQRQNRPPHEFPNGSVYEGQWVGPAREGHGVQRWPDAACYTGQWVKDKAQGMGKFVHAAGDWYEGQYLDDMQHGYGVAMYMDGSKYTGNFWCDKHHGDGVEVWPDGKRFQGTYYQGIKHGEGTFRWPDGSSYIGNFEANNLSGIGTYSWADGRSYTGEWEKNTMHGKGTFSYGDGRSYTGDFFEDVKHGHGVFSWPDGRQYAGEWKNGKRHGKGRYPQSSAIKVDCSPPLPMMLFTTLLLSAFAAGYHLPEPPNCSEEELMNGYNHTLRGGWMDLSMYTTWPRDINHHQDPINFTQAAGICTEKNLANASGNESLFCISTPLPFFSQCLRVKKSIPLNVTNVTNVLSSCHDFESIGTDVLNEAKFPFESRFCHKSLHGDLTRLLLVGTRQGAERWIVDDAQFVPERDTGVLHCFLLPARDERFPA